jgi:hypothetical protein
MAIWAQFRLQDGTIISDETDKYQILEYMEVLDDLCTELELTPFSELIDYSDVANDFADDLDEEDQYLLQELDLNKDDTLWCTPREAIYIMDTLLNSLVAQPGLLNAPAHHMKELTEEFEQCLNFAQDALDQNSEQFHLILIS